MDIPPEIMRVLIEIERENIAHRVAQLQAKRWFPPNRDFWLAECVCNSFEPGEIRYDIRFVECLNCAGWMSQLRVADDRTGAPVWIYP